MENCYKLFGLLTFSDNIIINESFGKLFTLGWSKYLPSLSALQPVYRTVYRPLSWIIFVILRRQNHDRKEAAVSSRGEREIRREI
jgi:hypothetical protein